MRGKQVNELAYGPAFPVETGCTGAGREPESGLGGRGAP
jgi:hypothetical protein